MLMICGIGIIIYIHYYEKCDPIMLHHIHDSDDKIIWYFVHDVAEHINGIYGIFISCLYSASLCAISSAMHTVSGIIYFDCIRPFKLFAHNDVNANITMRLIVFLIGTYCAVSSFFIERFHSTFQILLKIAGMTTGAKIGVFTVGLFYPFINIQVFYSLSFSFCFSIHFHIFDIFACVFLIFFIFF